MLYGAHLPENLPEICSDRRNYRKNRRSVYRFYLPFFQYDQANRRKVYISITPSGQELLSTLHQAMLDSTIQALSVYTRDELSEMSQAFETISRLMEKFNPDILLMPLTMK